MTHDPWDFARAAWDRHFQPLRDRGLSLERVDQATYWATHERELRAHFPPEFFFDAGALRTDAERAGIARIAELRGGTPLYDFCIARDGDRIAAMFSGHDKGDGSYRMWHTNIHTEYRRRGLYRAILDGTIAYTRELGFEAIISEHAPCNNAVLIAKLSAGFRIVALEVSGQLGLSIFLRYFHNAEHLAAYELRCGLATLTPELRAHGAGAFPTLLEQFRG